MWPTLLARHSLYLLTEPVPCCHNDHHSMGFVALSLSTQRFLFSSVLRIALYILIVTFILFPFFFFYLCVLPKSPGTKHRSTGWPTPRFLTGDRHAYSQPFYFLLLLLYSCYGYTMSSSSTPQAAIRKRALPLPRCSIPAYPCQRDATLRAWPGARRPLPFALSRTSWPHLPTMNCLCESLDLY